MAYKMFSQGKTFVKYSECEDGELLVEGVYLGQEISQKFGNVQYNFKQSSDGSIVCLSAAATLTKWIDAEVSEGDQVIIHYDSKAVVPTGPRAGKTYHKFRMGVDKDRKVNLGTPQRVDSKSVSYSAVDSAVDEGIL